MGKGDPCEICGGTESNLFDGFYYCAECGTQDTDARETLVENTMLADGTFISKRQKIKNKLKEGVKMSPEWYKWHAYNLIMARLTEQLVQLGAAPTIKMKVLWIWTRYIKKYQKKDEMGQTQMFSQLEESSESGEEAEEAEGPEGAEAAHVHPALHRVSRQLLGAMLALALNLDRSALQPSHLLRLVVHRLLPLNDLPALLPRDLDARRVPDFTRNASSVLSTFAGDGGAAGLPNLMGRLARDLALGAPRTPDLEALLAAQLRDLALPRDLGRLALALMHRAPVPFGPRTIGPRRTVDYDQQPDYETVVMAYVLVALKMSFGLDDDLERRLAAAAERVNEAERHPRAYHSEPGDTPRLFSPGEWLRYLLFRRAALAAAYAPYARERNLRVAGRVLVDHFEDHAYTARGTSNEARTVSDRVTMDIADRIPAGAGAAPPPLATLKPLLAALAPHAALAAAVPRPGLAEDFSRYSAAYACRALALPGADPALFRGVAVAGKAEPAAAPPPRAAPDLTLVHVRNCENKNWCETRRPTVKHVVKAEASDADPAPADEDDDDDDDRAPDDRDDGRLETFDEEIEGENIFDDDFRDVHVKEEVKIEYEPESFPETRDEDDARSRGTDPGNFDDFLENVNREREGSPGVGAPPLDSDDEGPPYDPDTFDRHETIKRIMIEAYRELRVYELPVRFQSDGDKSSVKHIRRKRAPAEARARARARDPEARVRRADNRDLVRQLLAAYRDNLRSDVLHQVARQIRSFVDDAEERMEINDTASHGEPAAAGAAGDEGDSDGARDVEVLEDDLNVSDDDDDAEVGPARDPLYEGDVEFDEKAHDARQLYVKLHGAAPASAPAPELGPGDEEVEKLLKEKIANPVPKRKKMTRAREKIDLNNIDHLVEDPGSITGFGYWFTHFAAESRKSKNDSNATQRSLDEVLPRSFRLVLREAAAQLRVCPLLLYRRLTDVEEEIFRRQRLLRAPAPLKLEPEKAKRERCAKTKHDNGKRGSGRRTGRSKENMPVGATAGREGKKTKRKADPSKENVTDTLDAEGGGPPLKRKRKKRRETKPKTMTEEVRLNKEMWDVDDDVASALVFF